MLARGLSRLAGHVYALSLTDMTSFLGFLAIGCLALAALLLFVRAAIFVLQVLARRQTARDDVDQIGHLAEVVKTIRPRKHGQIRYETDNGFQLADAVSSQLIRNGNWVMIQGIVRHRFKVRRLTEAELRVRADKEREGGP